MLIRFELRLELTSALVAASNRGRDRDRDLGRLVPGVAGFPHDPDGRDPQRGLLRLGDPSPCQVERSPS